MFLEVCSGFTNLEPQGLRRTGFWEVLDCSHVDICQGVTFAAVAPILRKPNQGN